MERVKRKAYNTRYSLVVTDPTSSPAFRSLCFGERTIPLVFPLFFILWAQGAKYGRPEAWERGSLQDRVLFFLAAVI